MVSCEKSKLETTENGKKIFIEGYDVELEDTILFPEGGGQVIYWKSFLVANIKITIF